MGSHLGLLMREKLGGVQNVHGQEPAAIGKGGGVCALHVPYPRAFCPLPSSHQGLVELTIDIHDITEKKGTVNSLLSVCVIKLPVYWSSGISRVAQFIFGNVLRFQFALGSFHGHSELHISCPSINR